MVVVYNSKEGDIIVDLERYGDVHSVAAVLKLYLYYLPEPLLYSQLYDSWKAASELSWTAKELNQAHSMH
jgi:hypothetical protein